MRAFVARLVVAATMALAAASATAGDWGNLATISSTLGANANRLCLGEGLRASDIGCPSYAPYVSNSGYVGIGTANPIAPLHISSSTATDFTSLGLKEVVLGPLSVGSWSATGIAFGNYSLGASRRSIGANNGHLYFGYSTGSSVRTDMMLSTAGNLGIGTTNPNATLQVSGGVIISSTAPTSLTIIGQEAGSITGGGVIFDTLSANGYNQTLKFTGSQINAVQTSSVAASNPLYLQTIAGSKLGIGIVTVPSATLHVSGTFLATGNATNNRGIQIGSSNFGNDIHGVAANNLSYADLYLSPNATGSTGGGYVAVGMNVAPSASLHVSGTVRATNFVGDGSGLTGVVASSGDRIVSGSTSMIAVSNSGYISLTQSGVNTGWFNPSTGFVTIGVSSTGPISGTNGYFSGNVGMGTLPNSSYVLSTSGQLTFTNGNISMDSNRGISYAGTSNIGFKAPGNSPSIVNGSTAVPAFFAGNVGFNGIGTTAPQATLDVSGSLKIAGTGGETCDPAHYGTFRRNPTTGAIQICVSR